MSCGPAKRGTSVGGCREVPRSRQARSLRDIVRAYREHHQARVEEELASFRMERTQMMAVKRAARATRPDGKRYDHQRRLSRSTLKEVGRRLTAEHLPRCQSFDQLHSIIALTIGRVDGVGELMIYDTALRIGARLGVAPERVYLHRGTRHGARMLALNWRAPHLGVGELPRALQGLKPHQLEDCLCIFARDFAQLAEGRIRRRRRC